MPEDEKRPSSVDLLRLKKIAELDDLFLSKKIGVEEYTELRKKLIGELGPMTEPLAIKLPEPAAKIESAMLRDPRVLRLLDRMMEGNIAEIKPSIDLNGKLGFRYSSADEVLGTQGRQTAQILESLAEDGILRRSFFEKLPFCPKCESFRLILSTRCPRCDSANIVKGRALEHFVCGHVGFERDFRSGRGYLCPKCRKELRLIGTDYRALGVLYSCQDCHEVFSNPVEKWRCLACESYIPKAEVDEARIYSYRLDDAKRGRLKVELKQKRQIAELLAGQGYKVSSSVKVRGRSGVVHDLDLFAVKKEGLLEHRIAIGISVADEEVGLDDVFKMYVKGSDVGAQDIILVAIPRLSPSASRLASHYNVKVLEAKDVDRILAEMSGGKGMA